MFNSFWSIIYRVFLFSRPRLFAWPPALALAQNLYFPELVHSFYYQSGVWVCIYQSCPPNLCLLGLAYDFYYWSGTWIFIYLSMAMVAVAAVILVAVVIYLE